MQNSSAYPALRGFFLLLLCLCLVLPGCASKNAPGGGTIQDLSAFPASPDETVYITVTGGSKDFNDDLASLVAGSLQSELGLNPADRAADASLLVDVTVKDVYIAAIGGTKVDAGRALANTAMATTLGLAIGSIAGHREGALIGAGVGAAVGIGVTAIDADKEYLWQLDAEVSMHRRGEQASPQTYSTTAKGLGMERQDAEFALKNQLSEDVVRSLRGS